MKFRVECWSLFTCHDFLVGDCGLWMRQIPQRKNCSIVIICHIEVLNLCFKVCPLKHFTFNPVNILGSAFFVVSHLCRSPSWQAGPQSGNPQRLQTKSRLGRIREHCKHCGRHRVGGDKMVGLSDRMSSPGDMMML